MEVIYAGVDADDHADGSEIMLIMVVVVIMTTIIMNKIRRRRATVATTGSTEPLSAFSIGQRGNQTRRMVMKPSCIFHP